ncbi:protein tyrosine phosphatase domain-containing protein 1 [Biomphalaria glabrata]
MHHDAIISDLLNRHNIRKGNNYGGEHKTKSVKYRRYYWAHIIQSGLKYVVDLWQECVRIIRENKYLLSQFLEMNPDPDEHIYPGMEELKWGEGIKIKNREKVPQAHYSALGEKARKMFPSESLCKMFCGGKSCKYCSSTHWTEEQMVIKGLYSEWVTHNILAMARLSNEQIEKFGIIQQFEKLNIKTVINLQQPGEHAYCGHGNDSTGFAYNPQILMESGIFFYNFAMEDYGVASMSKLLDIVKVMQFAVSSGKVAVHCHAGLGRTGLIIACYLIYNNRISAPKAVQYVRSRRAGSIQTKQQMKHCYKFEQFLQVFFVIFASLVPEANPVPFRTFLIRQRQLLHGYEARKLKHIPKVVYVCCERLLELCGRGGSLSSLRNAVHDPAPSDLETRIGNLTDQDILPTEPDSLASSLNFDDSANLCELQSPDSSHDLHLERLKNGLNKDGRLKEIAEQQVKGNEDAYEIEEEEAKDECSTGTEDDLSSGDSLNGSLSSRPIYSVNELCHSIVYGELSVEEEKIRNIEELLNKSDTAWQDLAREDSPLVIFMVMIDWIDQLNEPILRSQDISLILENSNTPAKALINLETSTSHFLNYITLVISKLDPGDQDLHEKLLELILAHLCQKRFNVCPRSGTPSSSASTASLNAITDSLRSEDAYQLFHFFQDLLHSKDVQKGHSKRKF